MVDLQGKVALVTGASKGIGAAIARRLAADGAAVAINYSRSAQQAEALAAEIAGSGGRARALQADISDPEAIAGLFAAVKGEFGRLDLLVNNAGLYDFGALADVTPASIDRHFNLNVKALMLCCAAGVPLMGEGGVVVNISSGVALTPIPNALVYCATKGAVDVFTRALAMELGPKGIRVVGVAPGLVATEGTSGMDDATTGFIVSRTPLGRIGRPADIAAAVAFACSADAGWITGETIQVGGGLKV